MIPSPGKKDLGPTPANQFSLPAGILERWKPGFPKGKLISMASRMLLLAALGVLFLSGQSLPVANVNAQTDFIQLIWSTDPPAFIVAGKPLKIQVQVGALQGNKHIDDSHLFLGTGGLSPALDGGGNWGSTPTCTFTATPPSVDCLDYFVEQEDQFGWFLILNVPPNFVGGTDLAREIEAFFQMRGDVQTDSNYGIMVATQADLAITKVGAAQARAGQPFT
ncbi:MAG: hypothetical protein HY326_02930, partial [Chloroflexi bacterium]|nr:hypothetical protein [Chloroflexota bacterium]